jgi:hypothetical protein
LKGQAKATAYGRFGLQAPPNRRYVVTLLGRIVEVAGLSPRSRDEMFSLIDRYFAGMSRANFDADLNEKQWVIQLLDSATGAIRGFSTQALWELDVDGRQVSAVYSGDTIIDRDHWGSNSLAQLWGQFVTSLIDERPDSELVWFLITMGYKTYRFLPIFFREFYPRCDAPTPGWAKAIIDAAARFKYASTYDASVGIIRAGPTTCRLRPGVADVTAERLRDPHVRFFAERNPGHARGDELCCIAPLERANFTGVAHRLLRSAPLANVVAS